LRLAAARTVRKITREVLERFIADPPKVFSVKNAGPTRCGRGQSSGHFTPGRTILQTETGSDGTAGPVMGSVA
jgi:hypothetical protein